MKAPEYAYAACTGFGTAVVVIQRTEVVKRGPKTAKLAKALQGNEYRTLISLDMLHLTPSAALTAYVKRLNNEIAVARDKIKRCEALIDAAANPTTEW